MPPPAHPRGNDVLPVRSVRWMRAVGVVTIVVGASVLVGWTFGIEVLMSEIPGLVAMKANSAVVLIALGAALLLAAEDAGPGPGHRARNVLAVFAIAVGVASNVQSWLGVDFGIDELLFRDPSVGGAAPGRMAVPTGLAFTVVGAALLLLHAARPLRLVLSAIATGLGCFTWLTLIAYFYKVGVLTQPASRVPMALHTSVTLSFLLAISAVVLARDGWARILLADTPAGDLARRLVPVSLLVPIVLGGLRIWGERLGWFDTRLGVALFALMNVIVLVFLVIVFASRLDRHAEAKRIVERELERTSARLAAVLDSVGHAVVVMDARRRVVLFSRTAGQMLGLESADALGRDAASFHAPADRDAARRWYDEAIASGTDATVEWRWARPDGTMLDVGLTLSPVREGPEVSGFVAVASDITLRKDAERAMVEARVAAEEASVQKTRFLANMSHELRTPLNGVIGYAYLLRQTGAATFTPDQLRQLSVIESSGRHLLQLINDILDLSKVESGKMTLKPEPVEPASLVEQCRQLVSAAAAERNISVEANIARDVPLLFVDPKMLKQILLNLLGNAVKFTSPGGRVSIEVAPLGARRVAVRVTDTGIGIDPADQSRIFNAFEQVDSEYGRDHQGTGLGLTLTRRLVELHGGTIAVESEGNGRGSTFVVELPARAPAPAQPFDEASFSGASSGPLVLVADDDPSTREILGRALAEGGYGVAFAARTDDLLRKARELSPCAITLDILMPPQNGWEVLSRLKSDEATRHIPVVVVSVVDEKVFGFSLDAADYLVKPVDAEHLRQTISRVVREQPRAPRRILVADDDPAVRELLTADLTTLGYEVTTAADGEAALEAIERGDVDLAVIDLAMPRMNGLQLVRRLREPGGAWLSLPIIVYSARGLDEGNEWLEAMVDAVVSKSSPSTLRREMDRITGALKWPSPRS